RRMGAVRLIHQHRSRYWRSAVSGWTAPVREGGWGGLWRRTLVRRYRPYCIGWHSRSSPPPRHVFLMNGRGDFGLRDAYAVAIAVWRGGKLLFGVSGLLPLPDNRARRKCRCLRLSGAI